MTDRYWTGQLDSAFSKAANWEDSPGGGSPAGSVPGSGDTAHFIGGSADCSLDADVTLGGLTTSSGYSGSIDLAGHDLTGDSGADFAFAHSGSLVCGAGTITLDGGMLDWTALGGTLSGDLSTLECRGTCSINPRSGDQLGDLVGSGQSSGSTTLTFGAGTLSVGNLAFSSAGTSSVTLDASTNGPDLVIRGDLSLEGRIGRRLRLLATSAWTLTVTGSSLVRFVEPAYCDASGGSIIDADDGTCVDGGGNVNWRFAESLFIHPDNVPAATVHCAGAAAGDVCTSGGVGIVFTPGSQAGDVHG